MLPGVNRADKQTCRTRVYRQRKERALALHATCKTARVIARELDAKLDAVTKWITTGGMTAAPSSDSSSRRWAVRSVTTSMRLCALGAIIVVGLAHVSNDGVFLMALLIVADE